jgi:hypothetical protein
MTDPHAWAESFFELVDRFDVDAMAPDGALISVNGLISKYQIHGHDAGFRVTRAPG